MISHHHKCVFVHIPKNAGQSIEHVFLELLGLTYETRAPLLMRPNDKPELGPPRLAHLKWHEYVGCKYMTQEQFDSYFKFAIVRNPWDRAVSIYKYSGHHKKCSFRDFVHNHLPGSMWQDRHWFVGPQTDFICDRDGKLAVDFLGRFENLKSDFKKICAHVGLPPIDVPRVNVSQTRPAASQDQPEGTALSKLKRFWRRPGNQVFPTFKNFREYYDAETRDLVARLYRPDIDRFGYRFEAA
ncbi:sulfotransferase family protein [Pelagibius litoralis]|uniref:Sulfotransferase family protein n=1 Tax=Pelagibius litoralis TaxID=374515 RepID=A0A967C6N5_9PROT|nr:sulfotransferase family 2 domain-containing protein [Pelagibius litoralis]NIA68516.1 sulfotransferase family protein [Pelagibius litoralis]